MFFLNEFYYLYDPLLIATCSNVPYKIKILARKKKISVTYPNPSHYCTYCTYLQCNGWQCWSRFCIDDDDDNDNNDDDDDDDDDDDNDDDDDDDDNDNNDDDDDGDNDD